MLHSMKKRKGFTLIELIVVMAIIAILVLLASPKYLNYTKDAHVTAMQQDAKVLANVALGYNVKNNGVYPVATEEDGTVTPVVLDGEVQLVDINAALVKDGEKNYELTDLAYISAEKTRDSLKGLKNELEDYVIVLNGSAEGEVVYIPEILTNSDGRQYISVSPIP